MSAAIAPSPGGAFNDIFGDARLRQGGVTDQKRHRAVMEEHQHQRRLGLIPYTVVNLNPFALLVNLGELGTISIPAATLDQPVQKYPIKRYRISMKDSGDGHFYPVPVLPRELAEEVVREYRDTGGVFCYEGEGEPPQLRLEAAQAALLAWHRREYQKAVDSWTRYHQHKFITDRQRDAARALLKSGELQDLPEWVILQSRPAPSSDTRPCPQCAEPVLRAAKRCKHCKSKIDDADSNPHAAVPAAPPRPPSATR